MPSNASTFVEVLWVFSILEKNIVDLCIAS
jgi:hypothetical protein